MAKIASAWQQPDGLNTAFNVESFGDRFDDQIGLAGAVAVRVGCKRFIAAAILLSVFSRRSYNVRALARALSIAVAFMSVMVTSGQLTH